MGRGMNLKMAELLLMEVSIHILKMFEEHVADSWHELK